MEQSETIAALAAALSKAQGQFDDASKSRRNDHLRNSYATLGDVIDATKPAMRENGLSFVQMLGGEDTERVKVTTQLMHESGEWLRDTFAMPVERVQAGLKPAQIYGSVATYARRYHLSAMLGVVADDDDDGHGGGASGQSQPNQRPNTQAKAPTPLPKPTPAAEPAKVAVNGSSGGPPLATGKQIDALNALIDRHGLDGMPFALGAVVYEAAKVSEGVTVAHVKSLYDAINKYVEGKTEAMASK
jgi:ERF superfamily